MIIVKNRELLIPNHERYIGTTYDNDTENRVFQVPRFSQRGVDLANLTFRLDIQYANESYDTVVLDKEVGEAFVILIWRITSATLQVPGTMYIGLRAIDDEATVKWSSFSAAMYAERHLNTPGNYGGSLTEIEQMEQDHQYMKNVINELKDNLDYAHDAEAWAQGTRSGAAVPSTDKTYHKNSKYYADQANTKATQAANSATAAANSATQAAETVADTNTRFNNAVSAVTVNTEVQDARVGADGTTYTVLKNRLDAEHTQLKSALKQVTGGGEIKPTREGAYINTSGTTADIAAFVTDATFNVFVVPCISGDKFTVDATGGNAPRAFAFLTSDGTILQKAGAGYHTNNVLTAPDNSAYLVINDRTAHTQYYGVMLPGEIDDINADLFNYTGSSEILFSEPSSGEYIVTNTATVDLTTPSVSVSKYIKWAVIDCEEGDTFTVNGKGGYSDRLWAFADAQKNIVRVSEPQATAENLVLTAQAGEVYLILNDETNKRSYYGVFIKARVNALEETVTDLNPTVSALSNVVSFIGTTQPQYTKIQAAVLGTVNQSYINFLAYPNSKSFVCKVLPNAKYYVVNPGGDRFRIVTTSFNPLDYVGGNQQAVDGNYFYGDESTDLVVTTKSTDGYMTVAFTASNQDISAMTAIYGNKENADKLLLHNLIVHDNKIGYSVDDTGAYYSSNTDYMGGYISTTTDISLLYAIYDALVTEYPAQVTKETFCTDTADNVTYIYKFVPPNVYNRSHERKTVFIICGTHGFEIPQMFHCANMFKEMLENWKTEPAFEALIMNYDFAVIPCLNVYGFTHDTRKNERGVDLNRNYETGWAEATGTEYTDPSSQYYKGTAPFSEVQTQAVRDFVLTNADKIAFCIDFHFAGSQTYINSTMDYIKAFYGWESHMNAWLMKHPDFALMDTSTNKTYLMDNMNLGSAALWLNTIRPSILLETAGTVGISGDSNAKTTQNYSETAFINALLFGLRWLRK